MQDQQLICIGNGVILHSKIRSTNKFVHVSEGNHIFTVDRAIVVLHRLDLSLLREVEYLESVIVQDLPDVSKTVVEAGKMLLPCLKVHGISAR